MLDWLDEEVGQCPVHPLFPVLAFNKQTKEFECVICSTDRNEK